jgi:hypothetical protein
MRHLDRDEPVQEIIDKVVDEPLGILRHGNAVNVLSDEIIDNGRVRLQGRSLSWHQTTQVM